MNRGLLFSLCTFYNILNCTSLMCARVHSIHRRMYANFQNWICLWQPIYEYILCIFASIGWNHSDTGSLIRKPIRVNDTNLDPGKRYHHNVLPESGVSLFLIFVFFKYLSLMAMVVINHFILPVLFLHFCTINLCAHLKMYIHSLFLYLVWQAGYSL